MGLLLSARILVSGPVKPVDLAVRVVIHHLPRSLSEATCQVGELPLLELCVCNMTAQRLVTIILSHLYLHIPIYLYEG